MNEMLPTPKLTEIRERFWQHYHVKPEPHLQPSDSLLSRISREFESGALTVHDPRKAKSLRQDQRVKEKKVSIGDGVTIHTG